MAFIKEIKKVQHSGAATGALYVGMLGLLLSDIIPTPADGVFFWYQRKIRLELESRAITPTQYWRREAFGYYFFNAVWWILVIVITANTKGDAKDKLKVMFAIIGAGVVVGIIANNIKKDNELYGITPPAPQQPPTRIM